MTGLLYYMDEVINMIKILENIFNSWLKRRESKYDAGLKREASVKGGYKM